MFCSSTGNGLTRRSTGAGSCSMALMIVSLAVLMLYIGRITVQAHTVLKNDEIEAYLNRVNKPAVKSFVINGDIVDCIHIYKQPAMDHPLLKDHKILTAPNFFPRMASISNDSNLRPSLQATLQTDEECPQGTVAIRRVQKSDLAHAKSLDGYGRLEDIPAWQMAERAGATVPRGDDSFVGASAYLNLWKVPELDNDSWSHGVLEVSDGEKSFVEGGWLVNPGLYSDAHTRLYAYWTADGYHDTGCYNLLCPGFVQVSNNVPLGVAYPDTQLSAYDATQYEIKITIYKDEEKMAWWLMVQDEPIGYWPISIFTNGEFVVAWTVNSMGAVLNTNKDGRHTITDMGSGHFAFDGWAKAAYVKSVQVMKNSNEGFYYPALDTFADNSACYTTFVDTITAFFDIIYYGGPGLGADNC